MRVICIVVLGCILSLFSVSEKVSAAETVSKEENCITCHQKITPGQVADWRASKHSTADEQVACSSCHGLKHTSNEDAKLAEFPDEKTCAECHEDQFVQFSKGKHNFGWTSMNAMPVTHVEPDELMEGGKGCGGCHNMGIKSDAQKKDQHEKGHKYQNNSCDECHTRHTFSKKEALNPKACQQCHMGFDHPQWEMWNSSKHGSRYVSKKEGDLPPDASAPTCQTCHMQKGNHENRTAWGFLGVRLPLPEDPQWKADRILILKALGVLNPETGEPTARLDAVKAVDLARLTQEAWQKERDRMISVCSQCHSESYAKKQMKMSDSMMQKADRLMGEAISIVADLYRDGLIKKPAEYSFAFPDLLFFMRVNGSKTENLSQIDQILFEMYMKHRMRTYQAFFHVSPDYAYWYGWAAMVKDLGEIQELSRTIREMNMIKN